MTHSFLQSCQSGSLETQRPPPTWRTFHWSSSSSCEHGCSWSRSNPSAGDIQRRGAADSFVYCSKAVPYRRFSRCFPICGGVQLWVYILVIGWDMKRIQTLILATFSNALGVLICRSIFELTRWSLLTAECYVCKWQQTWIQLLTHWNRDKMDGGLQTTFYKRAFSLIGIVISR